MGKIDLAGSDVLGSADNDCEITDNYINVLDEPVNNMHNKEFIVHSIQEIYDNVNEDIGTMNSMIKFALEHPKTTGITLLSTMAIGHFIVIPILKPIILIGGLAVAGTYLYNKINSR